MWVTNEICLLEHFNGMFFNHCIQYILIFSCKDGTGDVEEVSVFIDKWQ